MLSSSGKLPAFREVPEPYNNMKAGAAVIVNLASGKKVSGKFMSYSARGEGEIALLPDGQGSESVISLHQIKMFSFSEPRLWGNKSSFIANKDGKSHPESQNFEIVFTDGTILGGEMFATYKDECCLHIFVKEGKDLYIHTVSSLECIKTAKVGDHQADKPQIGNIEKTVATVSSEEELIRALNRQKTMPSLRLGEILLMEGMVTQEQIDDALEYQKTNRGVPLGEILIQQGLITTINVQQALAKKLGIPIVNLREYKIAPNVLGAVPRDFADKYTIVPIAIYEGKLVVATENPLNTKTLDDLRFQAKLFAEAVIASATDIKWAIKFYYQSQLDDASLDELAAAEIGEEEDKSMSSEAQALADNVVVKLINKVIVDAFDRNASDIHIEPYPGKGKVRIRFRKDGTLINYHELPAQYRNALISRIKIMAQLDISERRKPQDGKIDFKKFGPLKIELRVATLPTAGGMEDVVMRILSSSEPVPLDKLGLTAPNKKSLLKAIDKPYGLFLVCGPTGSGKTTTLHSILGYLNTPERKIWTAEDPVEITQKGLRQMQVLPKIGLTFAVALRSFLRADPDVIMVGEMRDEETASAGIEASLTGHLVFSTLHTNSAPESIVRLLDIGMDAFNFADALLGVLAQRLTKRLCADCKQVYTPSDQEMYELAEEYCENLAKNENKKEYITQILNEWKMRYATEDGKHTLCRAAGCAKCDNTGYRGRLGIHELLIASDAVKKAIVDHLSVPQVTTIALNEGMRSLKQDGIEKVVQGHTDISRIRAVCSK